ncbi:hypothetical protein A7K50_02905 [Dehalobacter sp. MCB1]|jgi:hypothetical protein|uniref:hypothetical protein n=1 Tax=Dehalobacter sp. MCB1 TaxID=1844756 RepID=UPI000E6CDF0F|nr:hypothetical protein [Dehalobacter sp. MCB1]RJE47616.1 hypothetical protein A7K50_02905 [Dehalobacter sp. MCB1]
MNKEHTGSRQKKPLIGTQEASFILRVSAMEDYDLQGRVEHVGSGDFQTFKSYGDMVRLMHNKVEEVGIPQSGSILRKWS